jgi:hypothetical protein
MFISVLVVYVPFLKSLTSNMFKSASSHSTLISSQSTMHMIHKLRYMHITTAKRKHSIKQQQKITFSSSSVK